MAFHDILTNVTPSKASKNNKEQFGVSDETVAFYIWVMYSALGIFCLFGITTNIINIFCFIKQGFKESVNISLLGLSFSDLGSLLTLFWSCISMNPAVVAADLPFEPIEVVYLASGMPHFSFTRVSSCLTAMITLERCLCITAPLKIKIILTQKRAAVSTVIVFFVFFFSGCPIYAVARLGMKFSPERNKTIIGLISLKGRLQVENISFIINNFIIPLVSFFIIVVCTTTLSIQLKQATHWRKTAATSKQIDRVSSRNLNIGKMVVIISTLFIVCFFPFCVLLFTAVFFPALSLNGEYLGISIIIGGLGYALETINSSANIFIYYHMSCKYRYIFQTLFYCDKIRLK